MPESLSYTLGYLLAYVATGVTLPSIFAIKARGFRVRSEIPHILVLSTTLDNLLVGTTFTAFRLIATHSNNHEKETTSSLVG
jgi:hypothetical protein